MANSVIKSEANPNKTIVWYCTYPNGRNGTNAVISIPLYNPTKKSVIVNEAYVYDSNGNWTDIKSTITITISTNYVSATLPFNNSYIGKLLRIDLV